MLLEEVEERWNHCQSEPQREELWRHLTRPNGRWFEACQEALCYRQANAENVVYAIERMLSSQGSDGVIGYCPDPFSATHQAHTLRAFLSCVRLALQANTSPQHQYLTALARDESTPPGLLLDFLCFLQGENTRAPLRSVELTVLLINPGNDGVPAALSLELLREGDGNLYPSPHLALCRDRAFIESEKLAQQSAGLAGATHDVRWRLARLDGAPLGHLIGPSLGAAMAIGLRLLLDPPEALEEIRSASTGISATINEHGELGPVSNLWNKLSPDAVELACLHTIVLAENQDAVPPRYLMGNASPYVIQARNIHQAVDRLVEHALPRRAVREYERQRSEYLKFRLPGTRTRTEIHLTMIPLFRQAQASPLFEFDISKLAVETPQSRDPSPPEGFIPTEMEKLVDEIEQIASAQETAPRFFVLGGPGSGKSTLIHCLVWKVVGTDRLARQFIPARVRLRDWEKWENSHPETSLPNYLEARLGTLVEDSPLARQWQRWLARGEALVLLDGLDEVSNVRWFKQKLSHILAWHNTPVILTSRTTAFTEYRAALDNFSLLWLGPLTKTQRDEYINVYPARDGFDRAALIDLIDGDRSLNALARTPLLLSILCFLADEHPGHEIPTQRAALYDKLVEQLLVRPAHVPVHYPSEPPAIDDRKAILAHAALYLQVRNLLTFTERELIEALGEGLAYSGYGPATLAKPWANALHKEFIDNSGLVSSRGGRANATYSFTHLTIHEYLSAYALWQQGRTNAEEQLIRLPDGEQTIAAFLKERAADRRWMTTLEFYHELANDRA